MIVIGVTGSIGMGKSTVARQFERLGAARHCADQAVHDLLDYDTQLFEKIRELFPESIVNNTIDRQKLGQQIFFDPAKRKILEDLLHPKVAEKHMQFVRRHRQLGKCPVVLDIPLLFETGGNYVCDITVVASAPDFVQRQRVLQRPHMDIDKFKAIVAAQMSDQEKRQLADYVVETGLGKAHSFRQVEQIMTEVCHA